MAALRRKHRPPLRLTIRREPSSLSRFPSLLRRRPSRNRRRVVGGFLLTEVHGLTDMATELEKLKANLATLEASQMSNVLSVRFEDQQVTYRSVDEMIKAMEYMRRRIHQLENPLAAKTRFSVARFTCR